MVKDYPPSHPPPQNKGLDHYLHHDLGMLPLLSWLFFAYLLILEHPDHYQNLISSSLYYTGPRPKISSQSMLSTNRQTDTQQTNQRHQKHNLLCQGGNKFGIYTNKIGDCLFVCLSIYLSICSAIGGQTARPKRLKFGG